MLHRAILEQQQRTIAPISGFSASRATSFSIQSGVSGNTSEFIRQTWRRAPVRPPILFPDQAEIMRQQHQAERECRTARTPRRRGARRRAAVSIVEHVDELMRHPGAVAREQRELILEKIQPAIERPMTESPGRPPRQPNSITSQSTFSRSRWRLRLATAADHVIETAAPARRSADRCGRAGADRRHAVRRGSVRPRKTQLAASVSIER